MIATNMPARMIALSISGAVHVVLLTGLLALWPARPEYAPIGRDSRPSSSPAQNAPPSRRASSANLLKTAQPAPPPSAGPETSWALVPVMVAEAAHTGGQRMLDHLWQSTLFAFLMGGLTLVFRKNDARVRYWMWFAATVKFLVPFAFLQGVGASLFGPAVTPLLRLSAAPSLSPASVPLAIAQISQPFTAAVASAGSSAVTHGGVEWAPTALVIAWALGMEFVVLQRFRAWRIVRAAVHASTPIALATRHLPAGTKIRSSRSVLEPAVVGMWRPVLLLPAGIDQRLTAAQLDAVIAHETCHISSRDNLTAGVQMLVECLFWFHPVVWWIGGRLIQERERACDEHVLGLLQNPRAYADGIVNVCKLYVGAPLSCVPGVSSSDLRCRIERIMRNEVGEAVPRPRRIALGLVAALILIGPISVGAVTAPPGSTVSQAAGRPSQSASPNTPLAFQAVSVKQNVSGSVFTRFEVRSPGRFTAVNVPAALLIRFAYSLEDFEVVGGPRWLESDRYDVVASSAGEATVDQKRAMARQVLQERFKLSAHSETRELPIYSLMLARSDGRLGPGLRRSGTNCESASESALGPDAAGFGIGSGVTPDTFRWVGSDSPAWPGMPSCGYFGVSPNTNLPAGQGGLSFRGLTMSSLAKTIALLVNRDVTDETKLAGSFDGDFGLIQELPPPPPPPGMPNPFTSPFLSIFTAFPEQLGLKLQASRGPVSILVIDAVDRPAPD